MSKSLVIVDNPTSGKGQFLVYEAEDGQVKIDVRLEDETVWLTQRHQRADMIRTVFIFDVWDRIRQYIS